MTIQDLIDKQAAIIAARDAKIADLRVDLAVQSKEIRILHGDLIIANQKRNIATRELQKLRKAQAK